MRLNKLCLFTLTFISTLFLFCSDERSDIITGAGGDVINDMDSTLTDMKNGFKLIPVNGEKVDSAFSIPKEANTNFSTQSAPWFMAGVNEQGDTLRANMQFRVSNGASKYDSTYSLEEAYLYFRAANDDTESYGEINVFPSAPSSEIIPIKGGAVDGTEIGSFELGSIDSIKLNDTLADSIFNTRTAKNADTMGFAFSILDYDKKVRKINNPYVILRINNAGTESIVSDTIQADFTFFTAFEKDTEIDNRADTPYSSQNTLRTAVFRVDINDIITAAKSSGKYSEVINATISFKYDENDTRNANVNYYKVVVLDELLANENDFGTLQKHFRDAAAYTVNKKGNVHSIKTVIRNAIDKPNSGHLYVYLRPTSDHSVIVWDKASLKVEAVLTPSR